MDAALETLRVLMSDCGVSPTDTEALPELLELLAVKAAKVVPDTPSRCGAKVLEVLMGASLLEESGSVLEAAARR